LCRGLLQCPEHQDSVWLRQSLGGSFSEIDHRIGIDLRLLYRSCRFSTIPMMVHKPNIALFSDDGPIDIAYMAVVIASVARPGAA